MCTLQAFREIIVFDDYWSYFILNALSVQHKVIAIDQLKFDRLKTSHMNYFVSRTNKHVHL